MFKERMLFLLTLVDFQELEITRGWTFYDHKDGKSDTGAQGPQGEKGDKGDTGPQGIRSHKD